MFSISGSLSTLKYSIDILYCSVLSPFKRERYPSRAVTHYQEEIEGLPRWLSGKESACNAGDLDSIPRSGRSPGEGNDNPFQYSCLAKPMDRGARQAKAHGVTEESDMT